MRKYGQINTQHNFGTILVVPVPCGCRSFLKTLPLQFTIFLSGCDKWNSVRYVLVAITIRYIAI